MKLLLMLFISTAFSRYCLAQKIDSIMPISMKVSARAVPNPVTNKLNIEVKNFNAGAVTIEIVNTLGTTVYNDKRLVVGQTDNIAVFLQLRAGNYYCTVKQGDKKARFGFIVSR